MNGKNELKQGAILSYLQMGLSIFIGIVYTPVMIRLLGRNEYGLYNTVSSAISTLSVLSLGFNASYIRYYALYKKENDVYKIYYLNGLFLFVFTLIGLIALGCGLYLTNHLEIIFDKGLTSEEYHTARILMLLLTTNLAFSFPMSVFSTIISAHEKYVFLKLLTMIKTVISPLVNLPLLLMGFRSIGLVVSGLVFSIITDLIFIYYVYVKLENRFRFNAKDIGLFKSISAFSLFIAINILVDQINNGIDRVLLGRFKGTASVAIYAVGASIYLYYTSISTAISSLFTPRIHRMFNEYQNTDERNQNVTDLFIRVGRIQFLLLMLVASGFVFFGKPFLYFWVGEGYDDSYYVALLLIIPASIPLIQNLGIEIQRAANKHQFRSVAYFLMAIINLALSIYLCQLYGAVGAAIGTCISFIVANGFVMNIYYQIKLGIDILKFWKSILMMIIGMMPAFAIGYVISVFTNLSVFLVLLFDILVYSVTYCFSVWCLSMNNYEKKMILSPFKKLKKGIKYD